MSTPRILVVEDENIVALDIRKQLLDLGYQEICTVRSADSALASAKRKPPDLALLDIQIEGDVDGVQLADQLRQGWGTPVVYMTALADPETIDRAKYTQPYGYLVKPIQREELHSVVETALHRHRMEKERVQAEERSRDLERQMLQSQKMEAIGSLTGGLAHELNNALMAVMGNINLASSCSTTQAELGERLDSAMDGCMRVAKLVKQLLGFAQQGRYQTQLSALRDLTRDVLKTFEKTSDGRISYFMAGAPVAALVKVDRDQFSQVVGSLLLNAQQATRGEGTVSLEFGKVHVESPEVFNPEAEPGTYLTLAVRDEGEGIDPESLPRIFEPFFSTRSKAESLGLGLAVVHGIMQRHGGWVTVDSVKGEGSVFTLYFPDASEPASMWSVSNIAAGSPASSEAGTIMVIDDERVIVDIVSKCLQENGYKVVGFTRPGEGLTWYAQNVRQVGVIILDMKMPTMSGSACFHEIKRINPKANVLVFSGYALDSSVEEVLKNGAKGFFEKPIDFERLLRQIEELLPKPARSASATA